MKQEQKTPVVPRRAGWAIKSGLSNYEELQYHPLRLELDWKRNPEDARLFYGIQKSRVPWLLDVLDYVSKLRMPDAPRNRFLQQAAAMTVKRGKDGLATAEQYFRNGDLGRALIQQDIVLQLAHSALLNFYKALELEVA